MEKRPQPERDVLPAKVAERVLARASELEAVRSAGTGVADLRAAAAEAGISTESFDAALGELRDAEAAVPSPLVRERRRTRVWTFVAGMAAMVMALGLVVIPRMVSTAVPAPVQQVFKLNCLSTTDAVELLKEPLGTTGTVIVPVGNPKVLIIRGTPEQLKQVHVVLDQKDGAAACTRR